MNEDNLVVFSVMVALAALAVALLAVLSSSDRIASGSALLISLIAVALIVLVPNKGVTGQLLNLRMPKNTIPLLKLSASYYKAGMDPDKREVDCIKGSQAYHIHLPYLPLTTCNTILH